MLLPTHDKGALLTDGEASLALFSPEMPSADTRTVASDKVTQCWREQSWMTVREIVLLKAQIAKLEKLGYHKDLPPSIEEALNAGDGAYRP